MIKRIAFLLLLIAVPVFAQDSAMFPSRGPIISKSIILDKKLNRTAPFVSLEQGSIVSALNMRRPASGIMSGWGPRKGMEKYNSTAMSTAAIDSLHQFINPVFDIVCFVSMYGVYMEAGTTDSPPSTTTEFGTVTYTATGATGRAFSDSIGDDFVVAADGASPWAWSGGTAYPDGFKIMIGGDTPASITITNDDFEDGGDPPTGWAESDATAVTGTTSPQGGSKDAEVTSSVAGDSAAGIYQDIAAAAGVEYTISYWARRDSLVTTTVTNEGFETGGTPPTGWLNNNATSVTGTTNPHGGSKDAVVTPTAADSESAGIYQDVAVGASTDYTITYWAYRVNQGYSMTNAGFETGGTPPSGWANNNATSVSGTTNPYAGSKDAVVTPTTAASESAGIYQDLEVEPNTEYNISYYAYHIDKSFAGMVNGDFETGSSSPPSGWTNSNGSAVTGTTSPHGGSKDAVVTSSVATSEKAGMYQDVVVSPNIEYTLTFWTYNTSDYSGSGSFSPSVSGDTGWFRDTIQDEGSSPIYFGNTSGNSIHSFMRFTDVTIQQGATINSAYITFTPSGSSMTSSCNVNVYFNNTANPVAPTDYYEAVALSLTSAVSWSNVMLWSTGYTYDSPELKTILQGIIDGGSWDYDKAVMAVVKDNGSATDALRTASTSPTLHITYATTQPALTVEAYTSGDSLISTPESNVYSPSRATWTQYQEVFTTPANTSYIRIYLSSYSTSSGEKVEFDDVTLTATYPQSQPSHVMQSLNSGKSVLSTMSTQANSPADSTWTNYSKDVTTHASAAYIRLYLGSKATAGFLDPSEFDSVSYAPTSEPYPQTNPSHVIQALDSGKSLLETLDTQENTPADSTWTQYSEDVTTPVSTEYIRLYLGAKAPSTDFLNEVEFDDVVFANTSGGPFTSHVMQFLDNGKSVLETASTQNNEPTLGEWVQYTASGLSPGSTEWIRLYLGCNSTPAGSTVDFDTLTSVVAVPPAGLAVDDGYSEVRNDNTASYITYPTSKYDPVYVGFRRPVDAISLYLGDTANSLGSNLQVSYWQGEYHTWGPLGTTGDGNYVDGTIIDTSCLAKSGTISWAENPSGETARILPGTSDDLYWYRFTIDSTLSSGIQVYKVLVGDEMEAVTNLWSGYQELTTGCLVDTGNGYVDWTAEVTDGTDTNYLDLSSLANTSEVYFGFPNRAQGINIYMVPASPNTDATALTLKYWDGDSWETISGVTDGTSDGADSLTQSGMIQWDSDDFREVKHVLGGIKIPYYWYQASWSAALDADTKVWEVTYAEKPEPIAEYEGVVNYNNYALWWPGNDGAGTLDYSQQNYAHVFNGPFAGTTLGLFGGGEVNAITMLGTSAIVSTKDPYQTYYLEGADPATFTSVLVSDKIGAIAPKSLISIDSGVQIFSRDIQVRAAIFMSADGVYLTDGATLINISDPIADYFDTSSGPYIEPEYMNLSYAWLNHEEETIHFAVAMNEDGSGTQTVLNQEIVYAYLTNEWYDVYNRATAANCGLSLMGSSNEYLTYIGGFLGYVYRTNTGTNDSGVKINHKFMTSSMSPLGGLVPDYLNYSTTMRRLKIKARASTTDGFVALWSLYKDAGTTTADATGSISLENSGYGAVSGADNVNVTGYEFALEFEGDQLNGEMELYGFTLDFMPQRPE